MTESNEPRELLPCPFCGGGGHYLFFPRDERHGYVGLHEIRCTICPASVYASDPQGKNGWANGSGEKAAFAAWNTRTATEAASAAEVAELREALGRAAGWFRDYERQHRAKGTADAERKADLNAERALRLELLAKHQHEGEG